MMNDLQTGRGQVYVTYFFKFWERTITFERKKLDTSFFVRSAVAIEYYTTDNE